MIFNQQTLLNKLISDGFVPMQEKKPLVVSSYNDDFVRIIAGYKL